MRDKIGLPRGYGFVVFEDPSVLYTVLQHNHTIDGIKVKAKRPVPRVDERVLKADKSNASRYFGGSGNDRTKKIVVRGLPPTLCEGEFIHYFHSYGDITDAYFLYEEQTGLPRGFGIIIFESANAVDRVLHNNHHDLGGKKVQVKRVLPKDGGGGGHSMGGGYQGYGCF